MAIRALNVELLPETPVKLVQEGLGDPDDADFKLVVIHSRVLILVVNILELLWNV